MNNKHIIAGAVVLAIGTAFTSCSHDLEYDSTAQAVTDSYNRIFIETFGEPAANQTWGFGSATTRSLVTRAVFTDKWPNSNMPDHSCNWESKLDFVSSKDNLPAGAIDITDTNYSDQNAANDGAVYYIPSSFNGELDLEYRVKLKAGMTLYNFGTVTSITNVNFDSGISIYNVGTFNFNITSQSHDVYNIGTFKVVDSEGYSHITNLYNGGALVLAGGNGKADVKNSMYLYSNGSATIEMPDGGDMKAVCDIHGTLNVTGDVKIQNSTAKYICGIKATGKAENVDGPLITSYVDANEIEFDGNHIYLLPGGHMKAKTTMKFPNSACNVYGHEGSVALIEATNFEFGNKNDFTHNFSNNIYFKVNGGYIDIKGCYDGGEPHHFNSVSEYLNFDNIHNGNLKNDEYDLAADRINAGNAEGSPACGNAWSVGDPTTTPETPETPGDDDDDDDDTNEVWDEWVRIIAEDLSVTQRTDLDFNDVVFDARLNSTRTKAQICLKAAGGTLPLTVGWDGDPGTSYSKFEVHNMYEVPTNVMVNTVERGVYKPDVYKTLTGDFSAGYDAIKIMVNKRGEWIEIEATQGKPAGKILVSTDYDWCDERQLISDKYPKFEEYVEKGDEVKWY